MTLFILICAVQLFYGLIFLFSFFIQKWTKNPKPTPLTVLICAHNAEADLRANLSEVLDTLQPEQEILVVDDHSTDGTLSFLSAIDHTQLRVLANPYQQGKKYAKKYGMEKAAHEYVLMTDADCRPLSRSWTDSVSRRVQRPLTLLYSPYTRRGGLLGWMVQTETYMTALQYISYAQYLLPYMGVGRNMLVSRQVYLENLPEGFYDVPYGDDDLFVSHYATRATTDVNYHADTWTISEAPTSWREWYSQKSRHSSTGKSYKLGQRVELALFPLTLLGFYVAVFSLFSLELAWILVLVRSLFFAFFYAQSLRSLGQGARWWATPIMEILWLGYLLLLSPFIFILNKKNW